jgi:hypothetical protein
MSDSCVFCSSISSTASISDSLSSAAHSGCGFVSGFSWPSWAGGFLVGVALVDDSLSSALVVLYGAVSWFEKPHGLYLQFSFLQTLLCMFLLVLSSIQTAVSDIGWMYVLGFIGSCVGVALASEISHWLINFVLGESVAVLGG